MMDSCKRKRSTAAVAWLYICVFWLALSNFVACQQQQQQCSLKQSCRDCVQTMGCDWCFQPDFKDARCFSVRLNPPCDSNYRISLRNQFSLLLNKTLTVRSSSASTSSVAGSSHENIVQVQPQKIQLRLRLNNATRISFFYREAFDYPVDLYYLMDLSNSMKDDKEKLSVLGNLLVDTMTNITSNFRLGFGSFVDKVVMPYVSTVPHNLEEPCTRCAAPYGFHNVMKLSQDTRKFAGEVNRANVSGNLDAPEGGFDAIMQAIVCREQIGWREKARKLLVFSTDSAFHYAGDGKLGGIVRPNDGCCHLDDDGHYTHSTLLDYPSVSQINLKVIENSVNVIFAVTSEQIDLYQSLGEYVEGSSCGTLSQDSGNVVNLVVEQYNKIRSSIEIKDTASSYFKLTYYSRCVNESGPLTQTNKCDGLKVGQTVEFQIDIEALSCPPDPEDWLQKFYIYPVGLSENLTVEVELLCSCSCEFPGYPGYVEKSESCSGNGTLKCGICDCYKDHFGRSCECSQAKSTDDTSGCRPDNITQVDCSGHGTCVCNHCECTPKDGVDIYWGKYCECNRVACDRYNGEVCSGPDHGFCACNGTCVCLPGWTGRACSCSTDTRSCVAPNSTELCSGHGTCICGECKCETLDDGTRFSGPYCQRCPTCPGKCNDLRDCVECRVFSSGTLTPEECDKNCLYFTLIIDEEDVKANEATDQTFCQFHDKDDCKFKYTYEYDKNNVIVVHASKQKDCPPAAKVLAVVFSLIGAIVLIGLAVLLLWKLLTTIKDRREFAKFEKERMMAKWDTGENPIYKQATSTFKNPTYKGGK